MGPGWAPLLRLLLLLGVLGGAASGPHSLRYFHVAVSEPSQGVPQFVSVGYVDGNPISRYGSDTGRVVSQADWMAANLDQEYWDSETQIGLGNQQYYRVSLDNVRGYYNQSRGVHTLQRMIGCDLLEDGSTRGYYQFAYDGKDYIALDLDTMTFTAADVAAQNTKRKWEKDGIVAERQKHYLENTCIEWLRRYVSYGQAVLERKEPPTVRVSATEAHGFLTLHCHAFGFYPRPIDVSWLKDGEVREQDTEWGGIVPNSDGTYYTRASIEARPEDRDRYRCRVDHASLPEPQLFASEPESNLLTILLALAAALLVATTVGAGVAVWRCRSGKKQKGYGVAPCAEGGSDGSNSSAPVLSA
ncbi:class I histocompatibility antigen, F10 alpha chain-like [Patagioenas fasciata]|uniref:class I histocompatibility antigen, F10 alpha chain-like n=1 Tax=Patagioenas fasciata TaxID=372321 RepID=UPI003A98DBD1